MNVLHSLVLVGAFALVCTGCGDESAAGRGSEAGSSGTGGGSDGPFAVDPSTGKCAPLPETHEGLVQLLAGPGYEHFHGAAGAAPPTIHAPDEVGRYCHGSCTDKAVDWAGEAGQVLQVSARGSSTMARARLVWSEHTGHGGSEYQHLYLPGPLVGKVEGDNASWFTNPVDPGLEEEAWLSASPVLEPLAVARGRITWSNNGVVVFRSGLVGAAGSGNSNDKFPFATLPAGRIPTDVAVTNNSELALVTVWDTEKCASELAVFALTSRSGTRAALPSPGFFESVKLLGSIPLPVARPTRISASVDLSAWTLWEASREAHDALATQAGRDLWASSSDVEHSAASKGYALIAARDEDVVVVVDLRPLLQYLRTMYFTTQENHLLTENVGPADDQWPHTFAVAPEAKPVVHSVLDIPRPASVAAGYDVGDRHFGDEDFGWKAYVAREDGEIEAWDMGALIADGRAADPVRVGTVPGCRNPTRISRRGPQRDSLAVACRGDRAVLFLDDAGRSVRRLEDSRFTDVVDVTMSGSRGAEVISVADYGGGKVLNYLTAPISAWGDEVFGGLGPDGNDAFEFTGAWEGGKPFGLSVAQVP